MRITYRLIVLFLFIGFSTLTASDKIALGQKAPGFELISSDNEKHSLEQYKGKIVVLEWINFGCPFVKKHYKSSNMQNLQKKYVEQEVVWLAICSSATGKQGHMEQLKIPAKLKDKGFNATAYLIDESGDVGKLYEAKTTPHMFVINKEGTLIYDGAIDDKKSTKIADIKTADNYVVNILDSLLDGKKPEPLKTSPYGCSVKYK
ncbi:MAG: thioredoxin family protein [Calditrichaeota bacterium]|nr:MAG: thioredoxin family protein [Calditrichota bacterium]MBL1204587.1 thioredoxin family protein [Calditrichota bacterium]NOG44416.1 thioredoxin family protein [Calditrichota bacterium]